MGGKPGLKTDGPVSKGTERSKPSELRAAGGKGETALAKRPDDELLAVRRELSISLPLLQDRVEELDLEIEYVRAQLGEERKKRRLLKGGRDLVAHLAKLKKEKTAIDRRLQDICEAEADFSCVSPEIDVMDCIVLCRVDRIVDTRDPNLILQAISLAQSIGAGESCTLDNCCTRAIIENTLSGGGGYATEPHYHLFDSKKQHRVLSQAKLETVTKILEDLAGQLKEAGITPESVRKKEEASRLACLERVNQNEVFCRLKERRDNIIEEMVGVESDFAALQVYQQELYAELEDEILSGGAKGRRNLVNRASAYLSFLDFSEVKKYVAGLGVAGAVAGAATMLFLDLSTGGAISGISLTVFLLTRLRKKQQKLEGLAEAQLDPQARMFCEAKITYLEGQLIELGKQKNEALETLQAEEHEIKQLTDGSD